MADDDLHLTGKIILTNTLNFLTLPSAWGTAEDKNLKRALVFQEPPELNTHNNLPIGGPSYSLQKDLTSAGRRYQKPQNEMNNPCASQLFPSGI